DGGRDRAVRDRAARRQSLVRDAQPAGAARRAGAPPGGFLGRPLHAARRRAGALAGGQAAAEAPGWSRRGARRRPARSRPALVALAALATGWRDDARARARLGIAASSTDGEIRHAAAPPASRT